MQDDVSVQLEALDILGDLLSRFGGLLVQFHPNLVEALSPQLRSPRLAVRKRAIICLGHLVLSCDQALYIKLINMLLEELSQSGALPPPPALSFKRWARCADRPATGLGTTWSESCRL